MWRHRPFRAGVLDQLFLWSTNVRDHPEFFTEAEISEIDPPAEIDSRTEIDAPAEIDPSAEKLHDETDSYTDPFGVRVQDDLDFFCELLDWAENRVEDEENKGKQQSRLADKNEGEPNRLNAYKSGQYQLSS